MNERLLDADPVTGLKTYHIYDPATEETRLRYEQDVEPLLDANKARQNATSKAEKLPDGIVHVASVPASIQLKWLVEKGVDMFNPDHKQAVAKLLDDSEWRYLKVRNIILGRVR